ncbi:alpha/beta hydrolase [Cognatishimia sp. SS12]|uniref:alpha/beta hydrolase n=1 Tax=Cognatishimia sp. SS12 TaxID=2979465 RepID=UPI00232DF8B8|nr:alpha/beta hydrolase [Cognatishimia sp. SS12]MDC0738600.1 alpha/beta hydrolase [Cognatishimia sp. SS12]
MLRLTLLCLLGFLGFAAFGGWAERLVLYPFDPRQVPPAEAGLAQMQETTVTAEDGTALIVWHQPAKNGRPTLLYFHGNAGNLAARAGRFQHFLKRGYGVIAPAYRGSSGSPGAPTEARLIADAAAVRAAMGAGGRLRPQGKIVIYGESLGSAVAIGLLAHNPKAADGVILEAPFASIADLAAHHYPQFASLSGALRDQWPSLDRAKAALRAPLLVLRGSADTLIPPAQSAAIHRAAPSPRKQLLTVPGGTHTTLWRSDVLPQFWRFIDAL